MADHRIAILLYVSVLARNPTENCCMAFGIALSSGPARNRP